MRRAALVLNPAAGSHRTLRTAAALQRLFARHAVRLDLLATRRPGEATALAREAAAGGDLDCLFAFGGDGTLREVAAGVLGGEQMVAVLPGGTTNVVAGALGLPRAPLAAARLLLERGAPRLVDVGLAGEVPFLMQATAGLDARALAAVSPGAKRRFGRLAVVAAGLCEWARYRFPEIEIEADGEPLRATAVAVCNLPEYGGPFRLAPGGSFEDRRLELFLFRGRRRRAALGFAFDLVRGRHPARPDVEIRPVEEVRLVGPPAVDFQVDGDPLRAALPLAIRLAPARLRLLAPAR
ncbi:MAG TPA: diacylglycerol kinase family protein [Thermoanaerobaculia bacterium]|nr:diacylglycerol kinase family protein [Thermoanaerobaculia bacterium]